MMRVVNPTFGRQELEADHMAVRPLEWRQDPMCLFSNSKPNADELLEGIGVGLAKALERSDIRFEAKQNAAVPAETDMLDWLAQQYRLVVLAIGD